MHETKGGFKILFWVVEPKFDNSVLDAKDGKRPFSFVPNFNGKSLSRSDGTWAFDGIAESSCPKDKIFFPSDELSAYAL